MPELSEMHDKTTVQLMNLNAYDPSPEEIDDPDDESYVTPYGYATPQDDLTLEDTEWPST